MNYRETTAKAESLQSAKATDAYEHMTAAVWEFQVQYKQRKPGRGNTARNVLSADIVGVGVYVFGRKISIYEGQPSDSFNGGCVVTTDL